MSTNYHPISVLVWIALIILLIIGFLPAPEPLDYIVLATTVLLAALTFTQVERGHAETKQEKEQQKGALILRTIHILNAITTQLEKDWSADLMQLEGLSNNSTSSLLSAETYSSLLACIPPLKEYNVDLAGIKRIISNPEAMKHGGIVLGDLSQRNKGKQLVAKKKIAETIVLLNNEMPSV